MENIDERFMAALRGLEARPLRDPSLPIRDGSSLTGEHALRIFEAQATSRHLDIAARRLRAKGKGYYTIGSAGHEGNAAVAAALRVDDPALLHYRSGGFYAARALASGATDPIRDVLLGIVAAASESMAGGRHKVFGHRALHIIPQTSTIASHLPRAVGVALGIARARKLGCALPWSQDAIVVTSFGDASANHSTATGAIHAAIHCAHQNLPLPILFVCEDNGLGISVRTPRGWIESAYGSRPHLRFFDADGADLAGAFDTASEAAAYVRTQRRPAFLRLGAVRLGGHAGSDVESSYRSPDEIREGLDRDPLIASAHLLVDSGVATPEEVLSVYLGVAARVAVVQDEVADARRLETAEEVMEPLARARPDHVRESVLTHAPADRRAAFFEGKLPEEEGPLTLALAINRALADTLAARPTALLFGEDVGRKGGVYGVTRRLIDRAGAGRVFDTILDEQSILGLALGTSLCGFLPIPEIQYLAYLHNAEDQLRGEAATLAFFSQGQYTNGMVVRIAGYGYQKGFGGHFHNDDAIAVLRDIPGLVIASPARPEDAAPMLRTCVAAAREDGRVCVFLEPIALYHTRDLHEDGDGAWLAPYAAPDAWEREHAPVGQGRTHGDGADLTLITFGNGLHMSLRVARRLEREHGVRARVLDLRWLAPLPVADILREAEMTGRVLVVDETRASGGVSEGVLSALIDGGYHGRMARVTSKDSFIPLGDAANLVLLSEQEIEHAALSLTADLREAPKAAKKGNGAKKRSASIE